MAGRVGGGKHFHFSCRRKTTNETFLPVSAAFYWLTLRPQPTWLPDWQRTNCSRCCFFSLSHGFVLFWGFLGVFFFYKEETSFVWGERKMQAGRVTRRKQSKDNKTTLIGPIDQTTVCFYSTSRYRISELGTGCFLPVEAMRNFRWEAKGGGKKAL